MSNGVRDRVLAVVRLLTAGDLGVVVARIVRIIDVVGLDAIVVREEVVFD